MAVKETNEKAFKGNSKAAYETCVRKLICDNCCELIINLRFKFLVYFLRICFIRCIDEIVMVKCARLPQFL